MKQGEYYVRRGTANDPEAPGGVIAKLEEHVEGDTWKTSYWAFVNKEAFYHRDNVHIRGKDLFSTYEKMEETEALNIIGEK